MKLPHRRQFLHLGAGAAALPAVSRMASAQAYPSRPVRIVVGFGAGSAGDIITRLMGQWLSERLGQPFVVENRAGAGGTLAAEAIVRAPADGYSILLCGSVDAINVTLYDSLKFNFIRDIAPVASIGRGPNVLVVHPVFPARTVLEFIGHAKDNPGRVSFASPGIGSVSHVSGELFKAMAGVRLVHVPYRSLAPALTDLIGGQVQAIFSSMPPAIEHIRAGRLRALAVTSAARSQALPDLPTIANVLPGFEASLTTGLCAPRNVPPQIAERINREVNAAVTDPGMRARLSDLGNVPSQMTSAEFGKLMTEETEKWGNVIRAANIKAE